MRVAERCDCGGFKKVYCVVRFGSFVVRYKKCDGDCGTTSKKIVLTSKPTVEPKLFDDTMKPVFRSALSKPFSMKTMCQRRGCITLN